MPALIFPSARPHRRLLVMLLLAANTLYPGCANDDDATGTLTINYTLGSGKTCQEVDVERIVVTLGDDISHQTSCGSGEVTLTDVPPGTYDLLVEALDDLNLVVMDSIGFPANKQRIEIMGGSAREEDITLAATPAKIMVRWNLKAADGGQVQCADVNMKKFLVTAWDASNQVLVSDDIACDAPVVEGTSYKLLDDPERRISGINVSEVTVEPQTSTGSPIGAPLRFVFEPPGAGQEVLLTAECTPDGCTSTGMPD